MVCFIEKSMHNIIHGLLLAFARRTLPFRLARRVLVPRLQLPPRLHWRPPLLLTSALVELPLDVASP